MIWLLLCVMFAIAAIVGFIETFIMGDFTSFCISLFSIALTVFFYRRYKFKKTGVAKKGLLIISGILFVCSMVLMIIVQVGTSVGNEGDIQNDEKEVQKSIIDVVQFADISPDELKAIMGEPNSVEPWNNETLSKGTFAMEDWYYYNDIGELNFIFSDNKVVRLNIYGEMEFDKNKLFSLFGITKGSNIIEKADTGYALRYGYVCDEIDDFWMLDINDDTKTMNTLKITYDESYFD